SSPASTLTWWRSTSSAGKPTRDSVSGRNRKRVSAVRWMVRTPWRLPRRGHVVSGHALALRKVCRAGFCRPRHAVSPVHPGATLAVGPRPETESRVGLNLARGFLAARAEPRRAREVVPEAHLPRDRERALELPGAGLRIAARGGHLRRPERGLRQGRARADRLGDDERAREGPFRLFGAPEAEHHLADRGLEVGLAQAAARVRTRAQRLDEPLGPLGVAQREERVGDGAEARLH